MPHLALLDRLSGTSYRVDSADAVVGRDPGCVLVLQGAGAAVVSGRHARFILAEGKWWIEDLGSRNGTFVASRRLTVGDRHRLGVGDEIALGSKGPVLRVVEVAVQDFNSTLAEPIASIPMQTTIEAAPPLAQRTPVLTPGAHRVRLVLRAGDGKRMLALEPEVIIGRSRDCGICVEGDMSRAVSRQHARVFYSGWKICIEDMGSRNGTWLNRKLVKGATIVERADVIEFGAGGPRLIVEDVALVIDSVQPTQAEIQSPVNKGAPFVSELPTPATERPASRVSNDKNK
ncbi:MAG: FHA domain-containing protein [Gemmatimonadaceae bacterium]